MPHTIVVPLDGSAFAERVLPTAISVAGQWPASLHLVTVEEPILSIPTLRYEDAVRAWARDYADDVRERITGLGLLESPPTSTVVTAAKGNVAAAIEDVAEDVGASLIVLATHGHGPLSRFWFGSVADALIRRAGVPILLVRPEEGAVPALDQPVEFGHVLIPLDGSSTAEGTVAVARSVASLRDARFTLIRLVRYPTESVSAYLPDTAAEVARIVEEDETEARGYLSAIAQQLGGEGLDVDTRVKTVNSLARGILHEAVELDADLIALATRGRGGMTRLVLGSVADKVLRGADRPVLVVRPSVE